jgi:hypothetical protein
MDIFGGFGLRALIHPAVFVKNRKIYAEFGTPLPMQAMSLN